MSISFCRHMPIADPLHKSKFSCDLLHNINCRRVKNREATLQDSFVLHRYVEAILYLKLYLHEAIAVVLLSKDDRKASIEDIATDINARGLYHRKDGQPLPPYQVMQRAKLANCHYHDLLEWIEPNFVWLKTYQTRDTKRTKHHYRNDRRAYGLGSPRTRVARGTNSDPPDGGEAASPLQCE